MHTAIVPKALVKGDTIAFVSPSVRLNHVLVKPLARATSFFEDLGYHVRIIYNESKPKTFRQEVLQRCEEVHEAFRDTQVKAIFCTLGGTSVNELLPHLDYDLIKTNPKIFCGYSDITLLHYAIFAQTGLQTFYSPAAISELGDYPKPMEFTSDHLFHVLSNSAGKEVGPLPRSPIWAAKLPDFFLNPSSENVRETEVAPGWTWLRPGKAKGRLFGGCATRIAILAGTKYWPDHAGRILVLENPMGEVLTDPLPLGTSRAAMADLVNLGLFENINGLVIGRPFGYDEKMRKDFEKMVLDQCFGTDFPILINVDIGHTDPVLTIPMNAMASLDSSKDEFSILEPAVLEN